MAIFVKKTERKILKFTMATLSSYGAMWLLINSFTALNFGKVPENYMVWSYFGLLLVSLTIGAWRSKEKNKLIINVNGIKIQIFTGDLFSLRGQQVIPVNEYFDSLIGKPVSKTSVHGQFILKILDGKSDDFNELVDAALNGKNFTIVQEKTFQPYKRFGLGTTAFLQDIGGNDYYLVALARTDIATAKAKSTREDFLYSLNGLWKAVHEHSNGNILNIPVLGSGLSNVSPDITMLIRIIIFSLSVQNEIPTKNISIVLYGDQAKDVDLSLIDIEWGKYL
jgi:hypothetical protein